MTIGALPDERRNTNPRRDVATERKRGSPALPSELELHDARGIVQIPSARAIPAGSPFVLLMASDSVPTRSRAMTRHHR